jgi:arachidonate 15-lipoxygenase
VDLLWNQTLVEAATRRHHWLQLYRYSLQENIQFFKAEVAHYIEHILPDLFNEYGTEKKGQYHILRTVISTWQPSIVQTVEEITSAFSGLIPLLALDQPSGAAKTLSDYKQLFQSIKPPAILGRFQSDETFGYLRVAGANPMTLQIAPEDWQRHLPLSNEQFRKIKAFSDDNLTAAHRENRLYWLSYPHLTPLKPSAFPIGNKYHSQPIALLAIPAITEKGIPLPIAIKCSPQADALFTPADRYSWRMAKNMVQVADMNHQTLVAHLAHTHLLMEAFVLATHRHLALTHPLNLLLAPHLEGTAFINWVAKEYGLTKGNLVDQLLAGSIESSRAVAIDALQQFDFNQAMLPKQLTARGVDNSNLHFPYRDDALQLWSAIHTWVEGYIALYYPNNDHIRQDTELQAWATELTAKQGGRIRGFGEQRHGTIQTREYLASAITMVIFTASAQHAAVNFPHRTLMS